MNRELAASHALSLYGARAEALLEPRKCQGWDLHTQPGTLSRISASTAARRSGMLAGIGSARALGREVSHVAAEE